MQTGIMSSAFFELMEFEIREGAGDMERIHDALEWANIRLDLKPDKMVLGKEFGGSGVVRRSVAKGCPCKKLLKETSSAAF